MRSVNKDFSAPPLALQKGFEEIKNNLMEKKSDHQFDHRIYNNAVKDELKILYHKKCAYCESMLSFDSFTIEHYRPKKGSYSYYWLGYEWSNLLPVCKKCNNSKGDRFPVEAPSKVLPHSKNKKRVASPLLLSNGDLDTEAMKANHSYLLDEKPYLLHPEIDEPKAFLRLKSNGEMSNLIEQKSNSYGYNRAIFTIRLTNLNRDVLVWKRRKIINDLENSLKRKTILLLKYIIQKEDQNHLEWGIKLAFFDLFESIEYQFEDEQEYTFTAWWTWNNIKTILFEPVSKNNKEIESLLEYALKLYLES